MRVALVGCGRWGALVLRDLLALGCDVPVVAQSLETAERAREVGATTVVGTIGELGDVRGVVVVTPTSTHAAVVEETLALGVPVFVEKPLCPDPDAAVKLADLGAGRLFVMDKWRYHPGVKALAEVARNGSLGPVRGLRTVRVGWGVRYTDVDSVWVLAPHDLSIALEILGRVPRPLAARGWGNTSGGVVLHGLLAAGEVWQAIEVSARSPQQIRRVELHCDSGVAVLASGWDDHITVHRLGEDPAGDRVEAPGELPLLAELREFVAHLDGGLPPRTAAKDAAAIVEAIAALRTLAGLA
jgi:predicted dehydrogenase